ncbi:MAG TPA: hypothetical protein ENN80_12735 [Candidatus Hydrogenedentes bacterium]|nr:hypothetical protein [Candidatus Hydrogenedentota bacterium]
MMRRAAIALLISVSAVAQESKPPAEWPQEVIDLAATMPIQDGGRVKPLDTFAGFTLLQLSGRRTCAIAHEPKLKRGPTGWLLDCLLFPEAARTYAVLLVGDADVLEPLGAETHGAKRGRFAYNALEPARERIFALARAYSETPPGERDGGQEHILRTAQNIGTLEGLLDNMAFAHRTFAVPDAPRCRTLFNGRTQVKLSEVLERAPRLHDLFLELHEGKGETGDNERQRELDAVGTLLAQLDEVRAGAASMALFPPPDGEVSWLSVGDVVTRAFDPAFDVSAYVRWIAAWEAMVAARSDTAELEAALRDLHASVTARARERGEYGTIELEVTYYRLNPMVRTLAFFIVAFVLIAASWLVPRNRFMRALGPIALSVPSAMLVAGIVMRCIIRGRPPVTTLYETILFATAVAVITALVAEYITRQRIAVAAGCVLGVLGMLLANKYEVSHAKDTMPSMIAVLDTNFWLTAHVTTIAIGYGASLLAGAMAHIYIFGRAMGVRKDNARGYGAIARMTYGILCFGFLFTFMGTVLGGVWANESWGRFWGWDPKENGALLIVLWQLATLHARLGGYIRDLGVAMAAVMGAAIVAFSWWGVNLLGVGLHTYGFTSGTMSALIIYWALEALVLLIGAGVWRRARR